MESEHLTIVGERRDRVASAFVLSELGMQFRGDQSTLLDRPAISEQQRGAIDHHPAYPDQEAIRIR